MIASKVICDDTYSNNSWRVVGQGMFPLREINQMDREMCSYLDWVLNVKPEELAQFEAEAKRDYGTNYRHNLSDYHPDVVRTTRQRQVDGFINLHHPTEHRGQHNRNTRVKSSISVACGFVLSRFIGTAHSPDSRHAFKRCRAFDLHTDFRLLLVRHILRTFQIIGGEVRGRCSDLDPDFPPLQLPQPVRDHRR